MSKHIESGVVQFGNDWPGVFMRGRHALLFAQHLELILDCVGGLPGQSSLSISERVLRGLLDGLKSAAVNSGAAVELLKPIDECRVVVLLPAAETTEAGDTTDGSTEE